MKREEAISKIEEIARRVGEGAGLEIVEVELKGAGKHQLLRIIIDKPGGVTHADCETVARVAGAEFDAVDPITGPYELQVSSPGVERPLRKWQDWERFVGKKVNVVLKQALPLGGEAEPIDSALTEPEAGKGTSPRNGSVRRASKVKEMELKHFDGTISQAVSQTIIIDLPDGRQARFPFDQVSRAHLKFEW
jgi:ribosome maturation factor RimP